MELRALIDWLWDDYVARTPQARQIHALLGQAGELVVNDHIALRGFAGALLGIDAIAAPFVHAGYRVAGHYHFAEKRLDARHYAHDDPRLPRIFISELRVAEFSPQLQATVAELLEQVRPVADPSRLPVTGRPWEVAYATVEALRRDSEYAAWVAAHGLRANHFTLSVDALRGFTGLADLCEWLQSRGFALNTSGGLLIKGSPQQGLEQAATLADSVRVGFSDGAHVVPGCYYEFALRHPGPDGARFEGFIEGSADKIFESTDRRPA